MSAGQKTVRVFGGLTAKSSVARLQLSSPHGQKHSAIVYLWRVAKE